MLGAPSLGSAHGVPRADALGSCARHRSLHSQGMKPTRTPTRNPRAVDHPVWCQCLSAVGSLCRNAMLLALKSLPPVRWKREALRILSPFRPPEDFPQQGPRLIVVLAADYGNLGDVAITQAVIRFAARHLPSHRPYLVCAGHVFHDLRGVARAADTDDVVAIVGGGNMGDRYPDLEEARCRVVTAFRHNRIVSFPQSFDFSDTRAGRRALGRSCAAYSSHTRLHLFARERRSFDRMLEAFPNCSVQLAPDSVLALDLSDSDTRDVRLLVCLREDTESKLSAEGRAATLDYLRNLVPDAVFTDTVVPGRRLSFPDYEWRLQKLWDQFGRARCVVTDRLHGLIFSVINRTPCVAIESNNHKIRSTWETWLSNLPSARFLSDPRPDALAGAIADLLAMSAPALALGGAFGPLAAALRG